MICYNCKFKSMCKYFAMLSDFPGEITINKCNFMDNSNGKTFDSIKPMSFTESNKIQEIKKPRSFEEISKAAEINKQLDAKNKKSEEVYFSGKCIECGHESDDLAKCCKCGALVCPEHLNTDICDGKNYCTKCYEEV